MSTAGGEEPRWSHDGRELFYRSADGHMLAVDVVTSPSFRAGTPKALFATKSYESLQYDVSPDGKRFLMIKRPEAVEGPGGEAIVVLNWFEELRRRAPVGK